MKKMIFAALALAFSSSALAINGNPNDVTCNVIKLVEGGGPSVGAVSLSCATQDVKTLGTEVGVMQFECKNDGKKIAVSVKLPVVGFILSEGQSLSAQGPSDLTSYLTTPEVVLVTGCRN